MAAACPSSLRRTSAVLSLGLAAMASARAVRAEPTLTVEGSPRFFAGEPARRRITGTAVAFAQTTWHVVVHGAEVARGGLESAAAGRPRTLALRMPAVTRRMPADLLVRVGGRAAARVAIEIAPDPTDEIAAAAGADGVGWVGPAGSVPPRLARSGLRLDELPTADALATYGGNLLVVASGAWDARRLVAPILARVRAGARVVAFGPDDAPWVDPAETGALELLDTSLADGWGREPLSSWGEDGRVARGSLRPPAGNHAELLSGRIRETYVGRGTLTLVRLAMLEHVEDEPFAVALLARLLARARRDPPVLEPPRAVLG
ncbi:MAG TPA: hypothetical protein VND21_08570, partial [Planctomycetota bacterium]|nr:hypothetical protein [Planctomycetota bacterium]